MPVARFPAGLAGRDVERIPTGRRVVALTFDGGGDAGGVPALLATLARERVPATFFLTGRFVTAFPESARRIAAAGHRLGDHSVSHPHFPRLTGAQIRTEVLGAAATIRSGTGADPAPLFRFPYGDSDARSIATVNGLGYLPVRWTVDSLGWQGTLGGSRDASFVARRVLAAAGPGAIVLMHAGAHPTDGSTLDAAALPAIIAGLRRDGYRFVTLDALLT
jgi:peptidoglycan/xylan/chitin deacetylase (PgdA/CDA1 family)